MKIQKGQKLTEEQKQQRAAARLRNKPARAAARALWLKTSSIREELWKKRLDSGFYRSDAWQRVCRLADEVLEMMVKVELGCQTDPSLGKGWGISRN